MRQLDVFVDGHVLVPLRLTQIGGGRQGGAGVQLADNARLGDAERLLHHHPVQQAPGRVGHLVEIVNAVDAMLLASTRAPSIICVRIW